MSNATSSFSSSLLFLSISSLSLPHTLLWVNTTFFPMSISVFSVFFLFNHIPSRRCFTYLLTTPSSVNFLYETKQPCRFGGKYFDRGKLGEGENMRPCTSDCMYVCVYA